MAKKVFPRPYTPYFSPGIGQSRGYGGLSKFDEERLAVAHDKFGKYGADSANGLLATAIASAQSFGSDTIGLSNTLAATALVNVTVFGADTLTA